MAATRPILYSYWRSSCSWRVRIALNLKGIDYEQRDIDMLGHEQCTKEFEAKTSTPFRLVPVLITNGGTAINESLAIIEYIEEKYPDKKSLLPGNAEDRARIRALSLQIIANLQPLQNLRVLEYLSEVPEKRTEWARHWIELVFGTLESTLQKCAGKFAYGDQLSLLDLCIPPQCFNARRFGVDMSKYPTIERIDAHLATIPEFVKADAYHQPDTPAESRKN